MHLIMLRSVCAQFQSKQGRTGALRIDLGRQQHMQWPHELISIKKWWTTGGAGGGAPQLLTGWSGGGWGGENAEEAGLFLFFYVYV